MLKFKENPIAQVVHCLRHAEITIIYTLGDQAEFVDIHENCPYVSWGSFEIKRYQISEVMQ